MSRDLPACPNLDYLKKQAKLLLRGLRQRTPTARLADAQRALAREYGHASWSSLKAHVESRPSGDPGAAAPPASPSHGGSRVGGGGAGGAIVGPPDHHDEPPQPRQIFHRFTEQARRVLFFARYEAGQLGSPSIEAEHLLLAFARDGKGLTSRILAESPAVADRIRKDVESRTVIREKLPASAEIAFSSEAKELLLLAAEESDRLQHHHIGAEHLLLGILRQESSLAASILIDRGLRLQAVRDEIAGHSPKTDD